MFMLKAPDWALLACVPVLIAALAVSDGARARRLDTPAASAMIATMGKAAQAASVR